MSFAQLAPIYLNLSKDHTANARGENMGHIGAVDTGLLNKAPSLASLAAAGMTAGGGALLSSVGQKLSKCRQGAKGARVANQAEQAAEQAMKAAKRVDALEKSGQNTKRAMRAWERAERKAEEAAARAISNGVKTGSRAVQATGNAGKFAEVAGSMKVAAQATEAIGNTGRAGKIVGLSAGALRVVSRGAVVTGAAMTAYDGWTGYKRRMEEQDPPAGSLSAKARNMVDNARAKLYDDSASFGDKFCAAATMSVSPSIHLAANIATDAAASFRKMSEDWRAASGFWQKTGVAVGGGLDLVFGSLARGVGATVADTAYDICKTLEERSDRQIANENTTAVIHRDLMAAAAAYRMRIAEQDPAKALRYDKRYGNDTEYLKALVAQGPTGRSAAKQMAMTLGTQEVSKPFSPPLHTPSRFTVLRHGRHDHASGRPQIGQRAMAM